jgi:pyruvate formate lyase activating enzyme
MQEVEFYHRENGKLVCDLCPHHCKLKADQKGVCRYRKRAGDKIIVTNYAQAASLAVDPIEKKPLYHFKPGSMILSVGANGCNLKCLFCQNCELSQGDVPSQHLPVGDLVGMAGARGSIGVAFTYSEPLMWYEYVLAAARKLRKAGYVTALVTNGFIEEEPLDRLLPYIDAMNIDLKSLNDEFYRRICKGKLEPVQRTIRQAFQAGVHVEITHLVVTGWNDNEEALNALVSWVASVSDEIPLHLSRYFPRHRYSEPPTSETFLRNALRLARQELKFVYLGNIAGGDGSDTSCPQCGSLVVKRHGYTTSVTGLDGSTCSSCHLDLPFRV